MCPRDGAEESQLSGVFGPASLAEWSDRALDS